MSTRLNSGMLNESQNRTNRAAFCDAAMSSVPARIRGWFATTPTERPPIRQSPVTIWPAHRGPQLAELAVVDHRADHVPHVVGGGLALRDQFTQFGDGAQRGIGDRGGRGNLVDMRRQVLQQLCDGPLDVVGLHRTDPTRPGVRAAPPNSPRPTSTPVNSATIWGPETNATASVLMTTRSERPSNRAGPETTGPVTAMSTGTIAAARGDRLRRPAPTVEGGHAVEHIGATRGDDEHEGDAQSKGQVGRFGQPNAVGVGERPSPLRRARAGDDHIAPAHAAYPRGDRAGYALADADAVGHTSPSHSRRI